jgi:hypothetical protein
VTTPCCAIDNTLREFTEVQPGTITDNHSRTWIVRCCFGRNNYSLSLLLPLFIEMVTKMTRAERKIWNRTLGSFTATGEITDIETETCNEAGAKRTPVSNDRFLKGPIPWSWIAAAAALPGQALLVGLCVWRLVGAMKSETVSLGNSDLKPLGIDRATKSRALCALERAGLIKVTRQPGRFPNVSLIACRVRSGSR